MSDDIRSRIKMVSKEEEKNYRTHEGRKLQDKQLTQGRKKERKKERMNE